MDQRIATVENQITDIHHGGRKKRSERNEENIYDGTFKSKVGNNTMKEYSENENYINNNNSNTNNRQYKVRK